MYATSNVHFEWLGMIRGLWIELSSPYFAFLVDYKQRFLYLINVISAYFPTLYAAASVNVCLCFT